MQLTRQQLGDLWRPVGVKKLTTANWSAGSVTSLNQQLDLSLPIRGLRFVFKIRIAVGTATYTSVAPEGVLNLIPNLRITGINKRMNGNVTLWDGDFATLFNLPFLFNPRANYMLTGSGGSPTISAAPTSPYANNFAGTTGGSPYDYVITCDLPFHPFNAAPAVRPAYAMFEDQWQDSIQIKLSYGNVTDNATNSLGVSAGTTVTTISAYGSGSGSATIDIYELPFILGSLKDSFTAGVLVRVLQPLTTVLNTTATNVTLANLEKQATTRLYLRVGTSATAGGFTYFNTLSDNIVTKLGVRVGGNRYVRNSEDVFAHRNDTTEQYGGNLIQGFSLFDFMESQNPDSSYPGHLIGPGATFQLIGDVTTATNAYAELLQEQILARVDGPLYA